MKTPRTAILGLALVATACLDGTSDIIGPSPIGDAVAAIPPTNNTACNVHWIAGTGAWTTAANWNPAVVPGPTSSVCIDAAGTYTVTLDPAVDATPVDILALDIGGAGAT